MLKKDKQNLLIIVSTLLFLGALSTFLLTSSRDIHQLAKFMMILFGTTAFLVFFISRLRQQRHLSKVLHSLVNSQTKLLQEMESMKSALPQGTFARTANEAETDMLKTVILELAKARGESEEEVRIPEPTNENIDLEAISELILLDESEIEADVPEMSFSSLDRHQLLFEVKEALKMDRIEVLLQPVVSLPQRRHRFYECFSRLRAEDNSILVPDNYLEVAENEGLISAVDNALLFRCIQMVRKAKRRHVDIGFFCNVSAASLADEKFIESFIEFIEANPELKPWLILEVLEDVIFSQDTIIQNALQKLSETNCSFSLDQLKTLDVDTQVLKSLGVRFVKINSDQLLVDKDEEYDNLHALRKKLERLRIDVIATKIESEARVKEILGFNVDYGQGYLFSPPRMSRI